MKNLQSFCVCVVLAIGSTGSSGVSLSVTPAAISNSYTGTLTLQLSGLTNGEPVVVERYLDINANGVIDPGDPLMDSFPLNDGGFSAIGGVTNLNVPWDSNPSGGTITSVLSLAAPIERVTANQIFRLVSPSGNFTPQTNGWAVTNANVAQWLSGTISSGGTPVPYAMAVVLSMPKNNFVGGVFADSSGHYLLKVDAGDYIVLPVLPNYFTDQSLAAMVTLTNGGSATANLFLTNGSPAYTVSGRIADATNGAPVGGVFIQFESGNLFSIAFSDGNGNYSAALAPGFWKIKLESSRLARRAYVTSQNKIQVDLSEGNVSNINFALPKANALFYGRFIDNVGVPFSNIDFYAQDNSQQWKADGFSDANGNYAVAVLGDSSTNVQWNSSPGSGENPSLQNYIVSGGFGQTNIFPGQALRQDFTAIRATTQVSGTIKDNSGSPVGPVGVSGWAMIGGTSYYVYSESDNSGNYTLPVAAATWSINVNCCGDHGLDSFGLSDPVMHSLTVPPNNPIFNITVYPVGTPFLGQVSRFSDTQAGFSLSGSQGANYTIQASTDLSHWSDLFSLNLTSNWVFVQDNSATNSKKFYRARKN